MSQMFPQFAFQCHTAVFKTDWTAPILPFFPSTPSETLCHRLQYPKDNSALKKKITFGEIVFIFILSDEIYLASSVTFSDYVIIALYTKVCGGFEKCGENIEKEIQAINAGILDVICLVFCVHIWTKKSLYIVL